MKLFNPFVSLEIGDLEITSDNFDISFDLTFDIGENNTQKIYIKNLSQEIKEQAKDGEMVQINVFYYKSLGIKDTYMIYSGKISATDFVINEDGFPDFEITINVFSMKDFEDKVIDKEYKKKTLSYILKDMLGEDLSTMELKKDPKVEIFKANNCYRSLLDLQNLTKTEDGMILFDFVLVNGFIRIIKDKNDGVDGNLYDFDYGILLSEAEIELQEGKTKELYKLTFPLLPTLTIRDKVSFFLFNGNKIAIKLNSVFHSFRSKDSCITICTGYASENKMEEDS